MIYSEDSAGSICSIFESKEPVTNIPKKVRPKGKNKNPKTKYGGLISRIKKIKIGQKFPENLSGSIKKD